ncbi:hypothetical protein ACS5PN_12745 [Roseateles sp. NT4]|uniref:hypothetical protein n=1 Tax=Roseateles sp. NT4 TaxID=3453715 RepID=UPI003EEB1566
MPDLDLQALPPELQTALERAWPGCPEAQRRALLAPPGLGWEPLWPNRLWAWQPARRWWRPFWARQHRALDEGAFSRHLSDARGEPWDAVEPSYKERMFDPEQPFFETPWTHAKVLLRSPAPDVFSDGEFWFITQTLWGGHVQSAASMTESWARAMKAEGALRGGRRSRWLSNALWLLNMEATGTYL